MNLYIVNKHGLQVKEDDKSGICSTHGRDEKRKPYFVCKTLREEPLGRPRRRWEDDIRMVLRETRWEDVDWIHLAHHGDQWRSLVNMVMNVRFL
jgi:hypothetical protein